MRVSLELNIPEDHVEKVVALLQALEYLINEKDKVGYAQLRCIGIPLIENMSLHMVNEEEYTAKMFKPEHLAEHVQLINNQLGVLR